MVLAIALVLLVVGSVLFHYLSPWYFTPIASNWGMIDDTVTITFWVTGFVFVAVNLFMAYCVLRYRHGKGSAAHYEPENKKLEGWLILATTVGVVAMLAPGLFVWAKFVEVPKDAAVFEVVGKQWYWGYRFPGKDGVLGTVDARFVSDKNPFGINPDDPHGQDDVLVASPEVHLPIGKPIKALLRSHRRPARLHRAAVPGQDGSGARPRHAMSGSRPPGPGHSTFSARNCAASRISRCAARSSSKRSRAFADVAERLSDVRADHGAGRPAIAAAGAGALRASVPPAMARRRRAIRRSMHRS